MIVRSGAVVNIVGTVVLALIYSWWSPIEYVRPADPTVGKQLILIGFPRIAEGITELTAVFPFNAILLAFGTEVTAAYHIGRRMYQQIAAYFHEDSGSQNSSSCSSRPIQHTDD